MAKKSFYCICCPCCSSSDEDELPPAPDHTPIDGRGLSSAHIDSTIAGEAPQSGEAPGASSSSAPAPNASTPHDAQSSAAGSSTKTSPTATKPNIEELSVPPNNNTNVAFPTQHDPSIPHLSTSHAVDSSSAEGTLSSSAAAALPSAGGSSSSAHDDSKLAERGSSTATVSGDHKHGEVPSAPSNCRDEENADVVVDTLIHHISDLLKRIEKKKSPHSEPSTTSNWRWPTGSSLKKLQELLSQGIASASDLKSVISGPLKDILKILGHGSVATVGLLVVAYSLERYELASANREECLHILRKMYRLAHIVKKLQKNAKEMRDEIEEATTLIAEGAITCESQITSSPWNKFCKASGNKENLTKVAKELDDMYKHIAINIILRLYNDIKCKEKPVLSRGYPTHAVGIEESIKEVMDLLDWESKENARAVILHGFGGTGKTTLGDAVFSLFDIPGCKYSKVKLFKDIDSKHANIEELQKLILANLMESKNIPKFGGYEEGQRVLGGMLEKVPALIYIDNALGEDELEHLLPLREHMDKAYKVRLLISARDLDVGRGYPMDVTPYPMRSMSPAVAMNLLQKEMSNGMAGQLNSSQLDRIQLDHIVDICGGIPLMLKLAARVIRFEKDKKKAYRIVIQDRQKLKGKTFGNKEHYFFAYDSLPEKDPFLDICSFFNGWNWNTVADIVGESELDVLEKRALVTKNIDGNASVHDVILTIGLEKTQKLRLKFTSASQVEDLLNGEKEGIQAIRGIWLSDNKDPLHINISKLDPMHSSLRVLALGSSVKVEGRSKKVFERLAFFQAGIPHPPFDMSKVKELRYLSYDPETLDLPEISSNLKHIELNGRLQSHASEISSRGLIQLQNLRIVRLINFTKLRKLPLELGDLVKGLEELSLSHCESLQELPSSVSKLQSLRVLRMDYCSDLKQLPENFSNLQSLRVLRMDYCSSLEQLTEDFGLLNSLQELNLQGCTALQVLPNNFENLSSLKLLNLSSCKSLEELPHGLGNLTSLVALDLKQCDKLRSIPDSIGQLKLLASSMDMSQCSSLTELPDTFCNLSFITHLSLLGCENLHRLPDRFGKLPSLRELNLRECKSLEKLPEGFGRLQLLEKLDLGSCSKLEELCNDFHRLSLLRALSLSLCRCLKKLPEDFHCLVSLQRLFLCNCECLETLPEEFHRLASLQTLHLHHSPMLEGKCMDNVIKMKNLQSVYIQGSTKLLERWAEIQREGDQSWSFTVCTGQNLSEKETIHLEKYFLSNLDGLLTYEQEESFHLSNCPPNTSILFMFDDCPDFSYDYPLPLIEETLNDIQIKFEMVYIGIHFDKLPRKVANKILGHAPFNAEVNVLFDNLFETLKIKSESDSDGDYAAYGPVSATMVGDEKDGKYLSGWKVLSKRNNEEFVVGKCGNYLRLKQLVEKSQESNKEILREMFATREEESSDHIFQKNCASHNKVRSEDSKPFTCGVDDLKGKTILLEIRHVEVCCDVRLQSLTEMYDTAKDGQDFEIISIPIVQPRTKVDIFQRFSTEVPWLVLQNPWIITPSVKYFLVKQCAWEEDEELETCYPSIIWIIEPNGKITSYKPSVFSMLDRWGAKSYPFADEKIKELKEEEWKKQKNMSSLEFLFIHLEKVKEILLQRKMIFLYGGKRGMIDFTCSIRAALTELRDTIYIIYIPTYGWKDEKKLWLTYGTSMQYSPLEKPDMPQAEMEGMPLLNLSEHEAMRFWTRLSSLKKEINEMEDGDMQLRGLKRLLQSFQESDSWMTIMDKNGEMVTDRGKEIVDKLTSRDVPEGKEKGLLLQELLHEFEQQELEGERRFSEEPMDKEEQREF